MRFERKYPIAGTSPEAVESYLRMHPLGFSELFPPRKINSLYFDSSDLMLLEESLAGAAERIKIRIRWYGDFETISKPVLEIKIRRFDLGDKLNFKLPHSAIDHVLLETEGPEIIRQLFSPDYDVLPAVYVSYSRAYLGDASGQFRVTVDRDLCFRKGNLSQIPSSKTMHDASVIAELKYESAADESLDTFANHFPFRSGKCSKYVKGMMLLSAN